jgi:hypothetical protein
MFDRRQFLSSASLTLLGLTGTRIARSQQSPEKPEDAIVSTSFGRVRDPVAAILSPLKAFPTEAPCRVGAASKPHPRCSPGPVSKTPCASAILLHRPWNQLPHRPGHSLEIPYKFDNVHAEVAPNSKAPGPYEHLLGMETVYGTDANREKTAHNMSEMWATFARTGDLIDAKCHVVDDPWAKSGASGAASTPNLKAVSTSALTVKTLNRFVKDTIRMRT